MSQRYTSQFPITNTQFIALCIALLMLVFVSVPRATAEPLVYLYTYHNKPPFIVDLAAQTGLYYDLAEYLSERDPDNNYRTAYVPRRRLDRMIESGELDGIVIGVSPVWFDDRDEQRFIWFPSLYDDQDEFVSLKHAPIEFQGLSSLMGKRFATVGGYYYFGVTEAAQDGKIDLIETIGERQVLELIAMGRADFGIVSRSVLHYLGANDELGNEFHFSQVPHDVFQRRAFTVNTHAHLHDNLLPIITQLNSDPAWLEILAKYQ